MDNEELIPIEQVLDDMYSDSAVSLSARDYYYMYYATEAEKIEMDREDKICFVVSFIFYIFMLVGLLAVIIYG